MSTALDLRGRQVGGLALVAPTEQRDQSGSIIWVTRCGCGCEQLRSAKYLNQALATGRHCACPRCLRGRSIARREARAEGRVDWMLGIVERLEPGSLGSAVRTQALLRVVLDWYGLYGLRYEEAEIAALGDECREALGEPAEVAKFIGDPGAALEVDSGDEAGQLWANLYPMRAPEEHGYLCAHCGETRERGWGCVECVEFVCYACGTNEVHRCSGAWLGGGMTLDAAADRMGVSRERVRQIEGRSYGKLRKAWDRAESEARVRRREARAAVLCRFPQPSLEERLAEMRRADAAKRRAERDAIVAERYAIAREAAARAWPERVWESEHTMGLLRAERKRQIAVHSVQGNLDSLPWSLRYPSALVKFGNSAVRAISATGLCSCVRCRLIIVTETEEATAHENGDCAFVFTPPDQLVAAVRVELDNPTPSTNQPYFAPPTLPSVDSWGRGWQH